MGKPRTSRKKMYNMPLHLRKKLLRVHLSKELKQKLGTSKRALTVKKGDKVKVVRGTYKGKEGVIVRVSYKRKKVYVEGISRVNSRGKDVFVPLEPSNLILLDVVMDKDREKILKR